jgi:hypothetical protein
MWVTIVTVMCSLLLYIHGIQVCMTNSNIRSSSILSARQGFLGMCQDIMPPVRDYSRDDLMVPYYNLALFYFELSLHIAQKVKMFRRFNAKYTRLFRSLI